MNRSILIISPLLLLCLMACKNSKEDGQATLDPDRAYLDYKITADEANDNLTILLQYRDGNEEGDALSIGERGSVTLDGELIPGDSTRMSGFFYELHKPITAFTGKHQIVFTTADQEKLVGEFEFQPVQLLTILPDSISRTDIILEFSGLKSEDYLRVLLTDTSFINDGINRVDTVKDGKLLISEEDWRTLTTGPVQMEFIREYEQALKTRVGRGGRLLITYALKRDIFLKD